MARPTSRRDVLRLLAGASLIPLVGCGDDGSGTAPDAGDGSGACAAIPDETGGPYPGDGTNGPNVLPQDGIVRADLRSSFGALSGTAAGVPMTMKLTLTNASAGCAALAGYAIYAWHCTRDGKYSLYTDATQNYLRGVQVTDASGVVTFTTIFPGCYSGRWPHVHFEIFSSLAAAMAGSGKVKTSQLALPQDVCATVYKVAGYEASVTNLAGTSLATDNVFSDGATRQLATVTGNTTDGFVASLSIAVPA